MTVDEMTTRIINLTSALAKEIDAKTGWQCGDGWPLGSCSCIDCHQHRGALTALGREWPEPVELDDAE
jgi:hypothetical protein